MNRRFILGAFALTVLGLAVISGSAITQEKMLNEQLTTAPTPEIRQALAPSGKLRVGVYPGSPFSMVRDPVSGEMKGIAVELGKALAMRLGVDPQINVLATIIVVIAACALILSGWLTRRRA